MSDPKLVLLSLVLAGALAGAPALFHGTKTVAAKTAHVTKSAAKKGGNAVRKVFWHKPLKVTTK